MSAFESEPTADNIMTWLDEGGYSCVLYLGEHRAYLTDEDDDYGWRYIPVAVARCLVRTSKIAVWDTDSNNWNRMYTRYRPTRWVAQWNMGQRPWFSVEQNQRILRAHEAGEP